MPMGWPTGVLGPVAPWQVSKEPEDIGHVGYQFYSDFCTENEYRVNNPLKFQIRRPWAPGRPQVPIVFFEFRMKNCTSEYRNLKILHCALSE